MRIQGRIHASLAEHVDEGCVWLTAAGVPERSVVRIRNCATGQSVYCEILQVDDNFQRQYNAGEERIKISAPEAAVVMNQWYRTRLGLQTKQECSLDVEAHDSFRARLRAGADHPQNVVRVALWLGMISVVLGLVGLLLAIISLCK